jgi:hypothetical protein
MSNDFAKRLADLDQAAKEVAVMLPSMLKQLHTGFIAEGFSDANAMRLTRDFLMILLWKTNEGGDE